MYLSKLLPSSFLREKKRKKRMSYNVYVSTYQSMTTTKTAAEIATAATKKMTAGTTRKKKNKEVANRRIKQ